jgi:prophage regulatory protein
MTHTRMLRLTDVRTMTGLSRSRIYSLEALGQFPPRRRLSTRATAWREDEVAAWIESRPRATEPRGDAA